MDVCWYVTTWKLHNCSASLLLRHVIGMANRLCFDIGLHLDCGSEDLPEKEVQIRNMTLFACVVYDK